MRIDSRFIDGQLPIPPSDGNYYAVRDKAYVPIAYTAPPESWAPQIDEGQEIVIVLGEEMIPHSIRGTNVTVNV